MGLDGISINQLRITPENNSSELNNQVRFNLNSEIRAVDGLNQGQKVDPDQEKEKNKEGYFFNSSNEENGENEQESDTIEPVEVIKYDLSKSDKYMLKIDDDTENILIVEKDTKKTVQRISADELSTVVNYLSNAHGSIINKRY